MQTVNAELKRLRESANPPISGRRMADELGVTSSAYHFYESALGFKQPFLPMGFARKVAAILAERGVNPDEVLALAGLGGDEAASTTLTAGEEQMLEHYRALDVDQRQLLLQLAEQLHNPHRGEPDPAAIHGGRRAYRAKPEGDRNHHGG